LFRGHHQWPQKNRKHRTPGAKNRAASRPLGNRFPPGPGWARGRFFFQPVPPTPPTNLCPIQSKIARPEKKRGHPPPLLTGPETRGTPLPRIEVRGQPRLGGPVTSLAETPNEAPRGVRPAGGGGAPARPERPPWQQRGTGSEESGTGGSHGPSQRKTGVRPAPRKVVHKRRGCLRSIRSPPRLCILRHGVRASQSGRPPPGPRPFPKVPPFPRGQIETTAKPAKQPTGRWPPKGPPATKKSRVNWMRPPQSLGPRSLPGGHQEKKKITDKEKKKNSPKAPNGFVLTTKQATARPVWATAPPCPCSQTKLARGIPPLVGRAPYWVATPRLCHTGKRAAPTLFLAKDGGGGSLFKNNQLPAIVCR